MLRVYSSPTGCRILQEITPNLRVCFYILHQLFLILPVGDKQESKKQLSVLKALLFPSVIYSLDETKPTYLVPSETSPFFAALPRLSLTRYPNLATLHQVGSQQHWVKWHKQLSHCLPANTSYPKIHLSQNTNILLACSVCSKPKPQLQFCTARSAFIVQSVFMHLISMCNTSNSSQNNSISLGPDHSSSSLRSLFFLLCPPVSL